MYPVSARFLAALNKPHISVSKLEVWNAGVLIKDVTQYLQSGGSVSFDETRQVRRILSCTLAGLPLSFIPDVPGDLFHPASCNELYAYRGIKYSDGTTEFARLGIFPMTKPKSSDNGESLTLTISGQDRSSVISRIAWQQPYVVAAGTNLGVAIQTAMASRWPTGRAPLVYKFAPTAYTLPLTTWGANPGSTDDPMADFITAAALAGMELFFDPDGNPVMRLIVDPTTATVVATFSEGIDCNMTDLDRTLDETQTYNGVQIFCNGPGAAGPFVVTLWATDPVTGGLLFSQWGEVPYQIVTTAIPVDPQTLLQAQTQGLAMAQGQLQIICKAMDEVDFQCLPNPALEEGDCLELVRNRMKVNGNYVAAAGTIPFDPESAESITNRPQRSAV